MKLSPTQQRVLFHMPRGKWLSASEIGASLATLNALHRKGAIERRQEGGAFDRPLAMIEFRRPDVTNRN